MEDRRVVAERLARRRRRDDHDVAAGQRVVDRLGLMGVELGDAAGRPARGAAGRRALPGNGANRAGTGGRRRRAVTCRSGVSGRSATWPGASRSSASSRAPSRRDRRDEPAGFGQFALGHGWRSYQRRQGRSRGESGRLTAEIGDWRRVQIEDCMARFAYEFESTIYSLQSSILQSSIFMIRLPRTLGLWSGIALVIGITIGSGIFRSPAGIARLVPSPTVMLGLWVLGGVITLCGALSLAELAAALPESGGFYAYLREGWGRPTAFLFGWAELVVIRASALGGISIVFGEYFLRSLGVDPVTHSSAARALAAGAIAFAATANIVGARVGATIVSVSTVVKFAALGAIIIASLAAGRPARRHVRQSDAGDRRDHHGREFRPGAGQRAVGVRRVRRPFLRRRRSEGSAAESPQGHHRRHARDHRHLHPGEPRLPLHDADRRDRTVAAGRRRHDDGDFRAGPAWWSSRRS